MILKALKYTRFEGEPREWSIVGKDNGVNNSFAYFSNINLLVGKNASGKSRTLDVMLNIADLFAGKMTLQNSLYASERFDLIFEDENAKYEYSLNYKKRAVVEEKLLVNGKVYVDRNNGIIIDLSGNGIDFMAVAPSELIVAQVLDDVMPYEPFVLWGKLFKNFLFSNHIEKNTLAHYLDKIAEFEIENIDNTGLLVSVFHKGKEAFGDEFVKAITDGMNDLGFPNVTNVDIEKKPEGYGIAVEEDSMYMVSQKEMAQGMFRILSMLIQLTYVHMCNQSMCIMVDDIGEGLDYDRSMKFINYLIRTIGHDNIQFFMTSNDRYVMNKVPLRYWTVIDREGSKSIFYNYENSKEYYDDFKYTGLNNFDFLTADFYKKGFGSIDEDNNV